jgi:antitoxin component of MazEF toxin-antitoxin module
LEKVRKFIKKTHKVHKVGGSYVVVLPKEYVEAHQIEAGSYVEIYGDDFLHIKPIPPNKGHEILEKVREELEKIEEAK